MTVSSDWVARQPAEPQSGRRPARPLREIAATGADQTASESTFATVRPRTRATKAPGRRAGRAPGESRHEVAA
jgi:hypothetical protein